MRIDSPRCWGNSTGRRQLDPETHTDTTVNDHASSWKWHQLSWLKGFGQENFSGIWDSDESHNWLENKFQGDGLWRGRSRNSGADLHRPTGAGGEMNFMNLHRWKVRPVTCYLEGPEAQFEEDLDVLHVFVGRLHQVDEHHVVDPKQRDQQEGGLRQTSGERTTQLSWVRRNFINLVLTNS